MKSAGFLGVVIWIPVFVALWLGVIGLAKAGRGGAWWSMLSGLVLLTLGLVVGVVGSIFLFRMVGATPGGAGPGPTLQYVQIISIASAVALGLGLLLFCIGFAMHGFRARRFRERIEELEMVVEAQQEQLSRSEGGARG